MKEGEGRRVIVDGEDDSMTIKIRFSPFQVHLSPQVKIPFPFLVLAQGAYCQDKKRSERGKSNDGGFEDSPFQIDVPSLVEILFPGSRAPRRRGVRNRPRRPVVAAVGRTARFSGAALHYYF